MLKTASYTLGDTLDIERERHAIALQSLREAGATEYELADAMHGLTVIDGRWTHVVACYVAAGKVNGG